LPPSSTPPQQCEPADRARQLVGIDQRPDRDEEEHCKDIAKWKQPAPGLVGRMALADRQAGDEGGQRHRYSEGNRTDAGDRQAAGDRHDQEEVMLGAQPVQDARQHPGRPATPTTR